MVSLTIATWLTSTFHFHHASIDNPKPTTPSPHGDWKKLWSWVVNEFTTYPEPHVWKQSDRQGHDFWCAYDPMTHRSCCYASEEEIRQWLEERYYLRNE